MSADRQPPARWRKLLVVLAIVAAGAAALHWHRHVPLLLDVRHQELPLLFNWDTQSYRQMAAGEISQVHSPFSKRVLYPWLAGVIAQTGGVELSSAFVGLNLFSFALLAWCLAGILEITIGRSWPALLLLLTPLPLKSLEMGYLPDLTHMALTALFFLLLLKQREFWCGVVLFVAFLTRESTLVLCLAGAFVAWKHRRKTLLAGSLAALLAGTALTSLAARLGQPNYHQLPDFVYLALKVPYNFAVNYLGVRVWTDTMPWLDAPALKWALPGFLQIGGSREAGIVFDGRFPLRTLILLLTVFGWGPVLLAGWLRRWRTAPAAPLAVQLALLYGALSYVAGPALGGWVERLIGYGWPAFWIALPWWFCRRYPHLLRAEALALGGSYVSLCWWPAVFGWFEHDYLLTNYRWCAAGLLLYAPVLMILAALRARSPGTRAIPGESLPAGRGP